MSPPMANRFFHWKWQVSSDDWVQGMISGWKNLSFTTLPDNWKEGIPAARSFVASYIKARPHHLFQMPESEDARGYAWASPRSWDMFSRLLAAANSIGATKDVKMQLAAGCIGEGAAMEFISWADALDLPDPEELLRDPDKFVLPPRGDQIFAILSAVTTAVLQKNTKERWYQGFKVLEKVIQLGKPDIAAVAAIALANNQPVGATPPKTLNAFGPLLRAVGTIPS